MQLAMSLRSISVTASLSDGFVVSLATQLFAIPAIQKWLLALDTELPLQRAHCYWYLSLVFSFCSIIDEHMNFSTIDN